MLTYSTPAVGTRVTCAELGHFFTIERDGCSLNAATSQTGEVLSDAGVDARERRAMLDRSRPMGGYLSTDGKSFTGWKGNVLGAVVASASVRHPWMGRHGGLFAVTVRDVHGGLWYGRGQRGMCLTLRAKRTA